MWRKPQPPFVTTGNAEAIDLICRRYPGCGSPSLYLRRMQEVGATGDILLDYGMAKYHRDREAEIAAGLVEEITRSSAKAGQKPAAEVITAKGLQCLVQIMFSK